MNSVRSKITTHVLDASLGQPASAVPVLLQTKHGSEWVDVATAETDADGRVLSLGPVSLPVGCYRIIFDTAHYFALHNHRAFYPEVSLTFSLNDPEEHYHVPLLLSPFAYSTYRGS